MILVRGLLMPFYLVLMLVLGSLMMVGAILFWTVTGEGYRVKIDLRELR